MTRRKLVSRGEAIRQLIERGLTEADTAMLAEARGQDSPPTPSRRKAAAKPRAVVKGTAKRAQPSAAKRPARRRA
jgi:hypothetical protein